MRRAGAFCLPTDNSRITHIKNSALLRERCIVSWNAPLANLRVSPAFPDGIVAYHLLDCKHIFSFQYHKKFADVFMTAELKTYLSLEECIFKTGFSARGFYLMWQGGRFYIFRNNNASIYVHEEIIIWNKIASQEIYNIHSRTVKEKM